MLRDSLRPFSVRPGGSCSDPLLPWKLLDKPPFGTAWLFVGFTNWKSWYCVWGSGPPRSRTAGMVPCDRLSNEPPLRMVVSRIPPTVSGKRRFLAAEACLLACVMIPVPPGLLESADGDGMSRSALRFDGLRGGVSVALMSRPERSSCSSSSWWLNSMVSRSSCTCSMYERGRYPFSPRPRRVPASSTTCRSVPVMWMKVRWNCWMVSCLITREPICSFFFTLNTRDCRLRMAPMVYPRVMRPLNTCTWTGKKSAGEMTNGPSVTYSSKCMEYRPARSRIRIQSLQVSWSSPGGRR